MDVYQYKAMDERGRLRQGRLSAPNVDDLEMRLERMGLDLINCRPVRSSTLRLYRKQITRRDLIDFCFQLEQLTGAGVTLLDGLAEMRDSLETPRMREVVSAVRDRIEEGKTLSEALAEYPKLFDEVFVSLVRVGEQSGELPAVFKNLTETLKWQDELVATAKKAVMYPAFVAVVVTGVVFFLMIYLVPELVRFITSMEGELPLHTRLLLWTSEMVSEYWYLLLTAPFLLWAGVNIGKRHDRFRLQHDRWVLKLPLLGEIFGKIILARIARIFALMYGAGVPLLQIIETAERTAGNRAVQEALQAARQQIAEGASMSDSFAATGLFPPLVIRMINVGENTGALDQALLNIAYFYDRDVKERIGRLEAVLEPALTVVLGLTLGWIMLATLGPVYDLLTKIQS